MPKAASLQGRQGRGAMLVELLVCIAIVAAVASAGAPAMRHWLAWHEVVRAADLLVASLETARSVAVARRDAVTLMPLREGDSLAAGWKLVLAGATAGNVETGMPADGASANRVISVVNLPGRCLRIVLRSTAGTAATANTL